MFTTLHNIRIEIVQKFDDLPHVVMHALITFWCDRAY